MSKSKSKRRKKVAKTNKKKQSGLHPLTYEITGLVMIGLAIIIIFEFEPVGRIMSNVSRFLFGNWHIIIPLLLIMQAIILMVMRKVGSWKNRLFIGSLFVLGSFLLYSHIILFEELERSRVLMSHSSIKQTWHVLITNDAITSRSGSLGGGMIGALIYAFVYALFDMNGAKVIGVLLLLIGLILLTGKALVPYLVEMTPKFYSSVKQKMQGIGRTEKKEQPATRRANAKKKKSIKEKPAKKEQELAVEAEEEIQTEPIISAFNERIEQPEPEIEQIVQVPATTEESIVEEEQTEDLETYSVVTGEEENISYVLPPSTLLTETPHNDQSSEYNSIQENARKLEKTFLSFGVKAKVTQVHLGPAVTKYEILPDTGVKVSRIVSLTDDLALALAASDLRIEAPIPGKSAVGLEVPNKSIAVVSLREVIEAKENNAPEAKLMISLGRDVTGQAILTELNKMPHMLIAGATGSGKSVCINGIIISILMRAKPHEVKLMMIDPKMVELNVYNGIPHLLAPVVTDPRKAAQALQKVVSEMERRYELFSHTGTRNVEGYNSHIDEWNEENEEKHPHMPYIVVIVDELADLMMVASSDVEDSITRLAQMARAAGIHLIIATQRPSVDVITGVIKANIPSRIAFAVSSAVDSRTILDTGGADKLLGRGDMLFLPAGSSKPVRIQGAFVSDKEVEAIVDFVVEQQKAQYQEEMIPTEVVEVPPHEETDELYDDAVQLVTEMQTASVSMLQRRFRVGYSRAARIVDQMEMRGIVGPPDGSRPRQVLVDKVDLE